MRERNQEKPFDESAAASTPAAPMLGFVPPSQDARRVGVHGGAQLEAPGDLPESAAFSLPMENTRELEAPREFSQALLASEAGPDAWTGVSGLHAGLPPDSRPRSQLHTAVWATWVGRVQSLGMARAAAVAAAALLGMALFGWSMRTPAAAPSAPPVAVDAPRVLMQAAAPRSHAAEHHRGPMTRGAHKKGRHARH